MKIALLSRNRKLYSTRRLIEAAEAAWARSRCTGRAALLHEYYFTPPGDSLQG